MITFLCTPMEEKNMRVRGKAKDYDGFSEVFYGCERFFEPNPICKLLLVGAAGG
jgi:hypothetical protein